MTNLSHVTLCRNSYPLVVFRVIEKKKLLYVFLQRKPLRFITNKKDEHSITSKMLIRLRDKVFS